MFSGTAGESAPLLPMDFAAGMTFGGAPLVLEKSRLDDFQKTDGGLLHSQGDTGQGVSWLCYTQHARTKADTPHTAWLTSTNGAANVGHTLSMVVVQNVDASKVGGCATAPSGFILPTFGIPGLGSTLAELRTHFGKLHRDRQGNVYFDSTRPVGDGSGQSVYQSLGYIVTRKGVVVGVAVSQLTTD
jgi:hypothetical protein